MNATPDRENSPFIAHWLIFGAAALLLGSFIAWGAYQEYIHTSTVERDRMLTQVRVVDENMARQLDAINRMLSGMRDDLDRWKGLSDGMFRASRRMKAMVNVMPGLRLIALLDREGKIIASSEEHFIGQNFERRDYFQEVLRGAHQPAMLHIGPPFRSASGIITLGLSRAVVTADGQFDGVVVALLEPGEFRTLMNSVRHSADIRVSLIHGDGEVFMTLPEQEEMIGLNLAARPDSFFNHHIASGRLVSMMEGAVPVIGVERMMALRTLQPAVRPLSKPLVIAVSRDLPAVFAKWRREAMLTGGLFGMLVLISGAGLFAYQRRQRSFERIVAAHEAEQRRTAERLKLATETAGIGVWEYDMTTGKQYWDDTMLDIYGMTREEFSGDYAAWWGKLLPEDKAMVEAAVEAALEQGKRYDIRFRIRRSDGQVRTTHALARVILDDSGNAVRVLGINEDITERTRAERALSESESRFREIFDSVGDAIFIHDAETGSIVDVNRRMCEMYGLTHEEALTSGVSDLSAGVPPYSAADAAAKIGLARAGEPQTFEWLARARDGHYFWVEVSLRLARIGDQERILAVVRDISERKHMDIELRIAAIAFESQDGIFVTDADSMILRVNHAFTTITGYAPEEAIGRKPSLLKSGRHDHAFYAAMWESIKHTGTWHGEIWNRRKNGEIYPEQLTITAVKNDEGAVTHYVGTMRDITERKTAEEQIHSLAFYDALTGLPNRRLLDDRLKHAMASSKRSGLYGALLFIDLDNFKPINDTYGHDIGDLLLKDAAQRIASCVREADTVARFGGDEFVVVLSELEESKEESNMQAGIVAEKIRATLDKPYMLKFRREGQGESSILYRSSSSIGIALFINHDAPPEDIFKWADLAMYRAKELGRNRVCFYDEP